MTTPNDRALHKHRELIFLSLALWGVTAAGCGDTQAQNEQCVPAGADREACLNEGCKVPDPDDEYWSPEFHFCMEVDDPDQCGACEDNAECMEIGEEMYREVDGNSQFDDLWLSQTLCGPAKGESSCCYTVQFDRGVAGRAFSTAEERIRVAPTVRCSEVGARLEELEEVGGYLSEYWRRVAEIEHASVASFARFTLQLMALGAPATLLAQAHRAGLDEIEHARLAYELAQRFGGGAMQAGRPSLAGALELVALEDPEAIVRSTLHEGCIGETLAAAWAAIAAARCRDPETKAVLEKIAEDELRHAALAWETLAWARTAYPEATRRALQEVPRDLQPFAEDQYGLPEWGVLGIEDETAISDRVMASTILPAIQALLA